MDDFERHNIELEQSILLNSPIIKKKQFKK